MYENNEFSIMFDELNLPVSSQILNTAIGHLKSSKSADPDQFINDFFNNGKTVLSPLLLTLFNTILATGYFPDCWSEGYIIPLHKKGSINNVDNYRGITLLSTLGKLFTRILNNRLNMGTVDNLFVLHGLIHHIINSGNILYCAFIDFSKDFDYVKRDNLWYKLIKLGLRDNILNTIRSMYSSKIKYQNQISDSFECNLGVRHEKCLSLFLFSMFLNDIGDVFYKLGSMWLGC